MPLITQTHVDILFSRIASHGVQPFFRSVCKDQSGELSWDVTTYEKFGRDIDVLSAKFRTILRRDKVQEGAVIGVMLNGAAYADITYLYALSKAGYVPSTMPIALTDPTVIWELLSKAGAQSLFVDPVLALKILGHNLPVYTPSDIINCEPVSLPEPALEASEIYDPDRLAFITFSSGSTNDLPKVIPYTNRWLASLYDSWASVWNPSSDRSHDVFNIPGGIHVASGLHALLLGIYFGGAFVQPTAPLFSSDELLQQISRGGLNRLNLLAPVLSLYIRDAQQGLQRKDDTLFRALQGIRSIVYGGMPMLPVFEDWAFENKLPIMNAIGTTETGPLVHCNLGEHPQRLRPFSTLALEFERYSTDSVDDELYKLAVLGNSPNIPDATLLSADGKFHPGDLFSRKQDGTWTHRGRDGDWIKVDAAKLVDTKAVEDFIRQHCSDILAEFVIVGNGRPSLALIAEPRNATSAQTTKDTIVARMATFNERRYTWERLSAKQIVFVGAGTLPRTMTKGNIRRKATEKKFEKELDALYV